MDTLVLKWYLVGNRQLSIQQGTYKWYGVALQCNAEKDLSQNNIIAKFTPKFIYNFIVHKKHIQEKDKERVDTTGTAYL